MAYESFKFMNKETEIEDEWLDLETRRTGDTTPRYTSNSRMETLLSELFKFQAEAARPLDEKLSELVQSQRSTDHTLSKLTRFQSDMA